MNNTLTIDYKKSLPEPLVSFESETGKSLSEIGYPFYTGFPSIYLDQISKINFLKKRPREILIRDGRRSALLYFDKNPRPPCSKTQFFFSEGLREHLPKHWTGNSKFYQIRSIENADPLMTVIAIGILSPQYIDLNDLNLKFKDLFVRFKNLNEIFFLEPTKAKFQKDRNRFNSKISSLIKLHTKIQLAKLEMSDFLTKRQFHNTGLLETGGNLINGDNYLINLGASRGATILSPIDQKGNIRKFALSPYHELTISQLR